MTANLILTQIQQYISDTSKQWKCVLFIPIVCILFISITLLATPPATGYEYSIYEPYSLAFWIVAGIIFLFPFLYLSLSLSKKGHISFSKKSAYGLLLVAVTNLVLLMHIPKTRGYLMYAGGDTHYHIGHCVDILNSGHLLVQNHYPLSHVYVSLTSIITDIGPVVLTLSVVSVFTVIAILSVFSLSRALHFTTSRTVAVTAFFTLPLLGNLLTQESIMPSTIGWSMIPLFLLVLYRVLFCSENFWRYFVLAFIIVPAFWFVHPETVVFPAIMIVAIVGFCIFANIVARRKYYSIRVLPSVVILIVLVVGFMVFFLSTNIGVSQLESYQNILSNIIGSSATAVEPIVPTVPTTPTIPSTPPVSPEVIPGTMPVQPSSSSPTVNDKFTSSILSILGEKSPFAVLFTSTASLSQKITLLIVTYGQLLTMSALCLIVSLWYVFSTKIRNLDKRYLLIIVLFFTFVLTSLVFLTLGTSIGEHIYRQYKYPVIFAAFLLGIAFVDIVCSMNKTKVKRVLSILFTLSLIVMLVLSMCTFYRSPGTGQPTYQVTQEDAESMCLLYEYRNDGYIIEETGNQHQMRYNLFLYGQEDGYGIYGNNIRSFSDKALTPPANFGYGENTCLGDSYLENTYYLQTPAYGEFQRWFVDYSENWGWDSSETLPSSWEHLSVDSTVNKIISGDAINLYLIYPLGLSL